MTPAPKSMSPADWGLIAALSFLWGGAFYFNVLALRGFPPNTLVLLRMAIACIPLLLLLKFAGQRLPHTAQQWRALAVLASLNIVLPFILFTWAQARIPSGFASVLNATTPLWGVVVAHFLTQDEKATPPRVAGVLIGVVGVAVMIGRDALSGTGNDIIPTTACLVATLSYAFASIYGRRFGSSGMQPMTIATGQAIMATIIMLPIAAISDQFWTLPTAGWDAWGGIIGVALLSTSLAYILYFRLLESAGATNSLLATFTIPIVAIFLGIMFLGETLALRQVGGIALIALGLAAIDGRVFRMLERKPNVP
jgi:drug/metabolite transporter (DMT)-like permease